MHITCSIYTVDLLLAWFFKVQENEFVHIISTGITGRAALGRSCCGGHFVVVSQADIKYQSQRSYHGDLATLGERGFCKHFL